MSTDARIDAYIAKAAPFAQPILKHVRNIVHKGCPHVEETIKWGMPFFTINGKPFCMMAAFKNHCRFGFWSPAARQLLAKSGKEVNIGMGSTRRITSVSDLPGERKMVAYIKKAAGLAAVAPKNSAGPRRTRAPKAELPVHPEFAAALKKHKKAATMLEAFSPTHRREYYEWISGAKQDETRASRISTAIKWIAQGKSRNWKYERC
jgi:uncharacterized protein YdeI (YjbR/CyaY-like superfamily)